MSPCRLSAFASLGRPVLLLAAAILPSSTAIPSQAAGPASKNPPAATRKVIGYALDELGRPVGGATVCLTRESGSDDGCGDSAEIAQTRSQPGGRFELTAPEADVKKALADPPAVFEIWIHKAGLAVAHRYILGEPDQEPHILPMTKASPATICLRKPDGSLCGDATVTPVYIWQAAAPHWSRAVPKTIQDQLKGRSKADGRATVAGLSRQLAIVAIETADFGQQRVVVPKQQDPPFSVTLCETRNLEGRLLLREGEKVDLSKFTVRITEISAETAPGAKPAKRQDPAEPPPPGIEYGRYVVRPDREGRFSIARFPKFKHGSLDYYVDGPGELAITEDGHASMPSLDIPPGKPVKIDIPIQVGRLVSRTVRDAETKRPLARVDVAFAASKGDPQQDTTDENGRLRLALHPGDKYQMQCRLPDGYLRAAPGSEDEVVVPPGAGPLELKPIELVAGVPVKGEVLDGVGQHLAGIRVRGALRAGDPPTGKGQAPEVSHWTTTDSDGHFQFDDVEAGTNVTLVPVRAGIALADPMQIAASRDKPVHLQEKKAERTALSGRIIGTDHKPIPGAQVVVEVEHSLDPTRTFRTAVDTYGSFQTPPHFPKQLKYRLTVRAILKDVASSAWICPATSGGQFADLVVERSKLGLDARFSGTEVVALVDRQPILASEILERAYVEPLSPDGLTLQIAAKGLQNDRVTEAEYRALQETAIRKYAADYARIRMLSRAYEARLDHEWKEKTEQAISKMFEEYVAKLKKDLKTSDRDELDRKLHHQGTSLASLKAEFRYRLLADENLRQALPAASDLDWQRVLAYYQAHRQKYAVREKVTWQLLEIEFDGPSSRPAVDQEEAANRDDPWGRAAKAVYRHDVRSIDDRIKTDLGSFDPRRDQGTATQSATTPLLWATTSEKTDAPDKRNPHTADLAQCASASSSQVSREKARQTLAKAIACEWMGVPFEQIIKKFSTGPNADQGGWQPRVRPESVADAKTSAALRQLPEGVTSGVIETDHSFRIVRVASRTPASYQPFEEVEQSIREHMRYELQTKALDELYSRTAIESPYIDDALAVRKPPCCSVPAQSQTDAFAP